MLVMMLFSADDMGDGALGRDGRLEADTGGSTEVEKSSGSMYSPSSSSSS